MSQIVVDTDVASYIFNWHSSAQRHVDALRGSELILSFMSIAEMRMGAIAARWGVRRRTLLEQFIGGFAVVYAGAWAAGRPLRVAGTIIWTNVARGRLQVRGSML